MLLVSVVSRLRRFRFYFFSFAFGFGSFSRLWWFLIVSFLVSRLVLGLLLCGGFAFEFSYSGASCKKCEFGVAFLPRLLGEKSDGPAL